MSLKRMFKKIAFSHFLHLFFLCELTEHSLFFSLLQPVDYENPLQRFFNLTVEAKDKDGHEDTCYVVIEVLDFNDNAPEIQPKTGTQSISEDAPPGTILTNFTATDRDSGINKEFE